MIHFMTQNLEQIIMANVLSVAGCCLRTKLLLTVTITAKSTLAGLRDKEGSDSFNAF